MANKIQICATVDEMLRNEILELSLKNKRTFSQTVSILLQSALKEKLRKRNAAKESNT
jgi:hypothetical protein